MRGKPRPHPPAPPARESGGHAARSERTAGGCGSRLAPRWELRRSTRFALGLRPALSRCCDAARRAAAAFAPHHEHGARALCPWFTSLLPPSRRRLAGLRSGVGSRAQVARDGTVAVRRRLWVEGGDRDSTGASRARTVHGRYPKQACVVTRGATAHARGRRLGVVEMRALSRVFVRTRAVRAVSHCQSACCREFCF